MPSEVRGKAFLKWTSIDLSFKLSLTYGGNVNYYKSVHNPIPTLPVGTGNALAIFQNKSVNSPFNLVSRYILFLTKLRGKKGLFWRVQKRDHIVRLSPRALGCHER